MATEIIYQRRKSHVAFRSSLFSASALPGMQAICNLYYAPAAALGLLSGGEDVEKVSTSIQCIG